MGAPGDAMVAGQDCMPPSSEEGRQTGAQESSHSAGTRRVLGEGTSLRPGMSGPSSTKTSERPKAVYSQG